MRLASQIIGLALAVLVFTALSQATDEPRDLRDLAAAIDSSDDRGSLGPDNATRLAIELGESAAPRLLELLKAATDPSKQRRIAWVLAYVGGPSALEFLREYAKSTADSNARAPFLFATPSAPSDQDTRILIESLIGPHIGSEWFPIVQASLSLGIMREQSATPSLQRAADKRKGFASSAAVTALRWMQGPASKPTILASSESDDLLIAALEYPVAEFLRFSQLCEYGEKGRIWRRTDSTWLIESGCVTKDAKPRVFVKTYRSTDGTRALMAIGFVAGPLDGAGYNYVFRRRNNTWVVVGVQPTWVS